MSTKIKFIGNYDVSAEGKFLWEILCQLRSLGVGRIVTKNEWMRKWPKQPSYLRIVKAVPAMDRWLQMGSVWADWTYRGLKLGLYEFNSDLNRSDWRLIHKHEEEEFTQCSDPFKGFEVPDTFPLPPLQQFLAKKFAVKHNLDLSKVPSRAKLDISVDCEFAMLRDYIIQVEPSQKSNSIYDEVDPKVWLDLYGNELPTKVEAWSAGPAETIEDKWKHAKKVNALKYN